MASRPVQTSLIDGMERPVGPLLGSVFSGTNADLMAAVAELYLSGSVLDTTYGRGKWWDRYTPEPFVFHDLELDGVDFSHLPHDDQSFETVCFDPPYVPAGGVRTSGATEAEQNYRDRFGLAPRSEAELHDLICAGFAECARVASRWLLVKCNDYVNGGRFNLGHKRMLTLGDELGLPVHDLIVHHTGSGPGGHNIFTTLRARRCHSYLLVFDARHLHGTTNG